MMIEIMLQDAIHDKLIGEIEKDFKDFEIRDYAVRECQVTSQEGK